MLETFTVNLDEYDGPPEGFFTNNDYERFVRLVVNEEDIGNNYENGTRDSHVGTLTSERIDTKTGGPAYEQDNSYAFSYTHIPIDLNEWYFIVASYNPIIQEESSLEQAYLSDSDFWRGNVQQDGTYVHRSGLGAKCKVEILSKSDLIRARGFKSS